MATPHQATAEAREHARFERFFLVCGFVLAATALLFFAWLAEQMLEGDTAHFDSMVRVYVHSFATDGLTSAMERVTVLGSSLVLAPIAVGSLVVFYLRREYHMVRTLGATFGGALALELILKSAFHRSRPVPYFSLRIPASYSFPSGHALVSLCVFSGLAMVISEHLSRRSVRTALWIATGLLISAIGLSRVYLGVHYPSDVLAGYAAGIVWLMTIHLVDRLHFQNVRDEARWARNKSKVGVTPVPAVNQTRNV